ncbi:hypothetical protein MW344_000612 [Vibrio parahaemolyticus]|uniref:Uncharacterized protein n=2 Tax=Vibrio parahaemolyticus TaxID=670 RepID=A0A9Q3YIS6_VIBPH|nr:MULTISPECIES: hypothetical protein [Vibrio]EGQ8109709.1 hypothetical protein [Vibrio parahaemolyticus]EGQ8546836.1 hypothetical protein [Vibrio parahaemolyticus]EGQ9070634.1 hypothetical protein [Vibrio parahaemolyticus]EGQ9132867.1 hypothetical protein [Vibrio parahaemolyticus]EGR3388474.1 hypothetical protein [Vibrio parahaemolyticus]
MNKKHTLSKLELLVMEKIKVTHEINRLEIHCLTSRSVLEIQLNSNRIAILEKKLQELEIKASMYSTLSTEFD